MSHQEKDPGLLLHEKQRKPPVFLLPLPPPVPHPAHRVLFCRTEQALSQMSPPVP